MKRHIIATMVMTIIATLTSWSLHADNGNVKPKRMAVVEFSESHLREEADNSLTTETIRL